MGTRTQADRDREQRYKDAGLCRSGCGRPLATKNVCRPCADRDKARVDAVKARGLCAACGKRKRVNATLCRRCRSDARVAVANWYAQRVANGLCRSCDQPVSATDKSMCESHRLERMKRDSVKREAARRLRPPRDQRPVREQRLAAGLCSTGCGRPLAPASKVHCARCHRQALDATAELVRRRVAAGICTRCEKPASKTSKAFCETHRQEHNAYIKEWKARRQTKAAS